MNKLLTTMLASSVLMMGAMTLAHAEPGEHKSPAKKMGPYVQKHQQRYAKKHHSNKGKIVTTASANQAQYAAAPNSQGTDLEEQAQQQHQHKGGAGKVD